MNRLLLVEDDLTFSKMLSTFLTRKGFEVMTASNLGRACKILKETSFDLILSDLRLPDGEGTDLLDAITTSDDAPPLIVLTGYADIASAVSAIKRGARDYLSKPVQPDILLQKIEELLHNKTTVSAQRPPQKSMSATGTPTHLEGNSEAAKQLYNYVALVAPTPMTVLINGASGTGKEYVAKRIHQLSNRSSGQFVAIDCGAIPKELAASEFFGHIKGSFTGAVTDKTGAFEAAHGGTLFLDEVENLSYDVQIQLLRALQERRIRPVGANREIEVDIRLVCATNEDLPQAIASGTFREDLYHRINEFSLRMPLLRERQEDIMLFANLFLDQANRELNKNIIGFSSEATLLLHDYPWPGNLRELRNIVKRVTLLTSGSLITADDLQRELPQARPQNDYTPRPLFDAEQERRRIREALEQTRYNKSKAARLLGIDRKTLYNKMKTYAME